MAKRTNKTAHNDRASIPRARATEGDDTAVVALQLPAEKLTPDMAAYFAKFEEKLGFVPNVLKAYASSPMAPRCERFPAIPRSAS